MHKKLFGIVLLGALLMAFSLTATAQVEFVIQYDDGASVYYSGRPLAGDTCGVWFEPPTECQILGGQFQFNDGMGGDAVVYVWDIVDDFDPDLYFDNDESGASAGPTPLGDALTGAIPITFAGSVWEEVVFADYGYQPEDLDVGLDYFYIGYKIEGTGAEPYYPSILGDADDDRPYHSLCYLTNPAGLYPNESGWWAYGIDWLIRARVNLYGDPPPEVAGLTDLSDTYTAGPYTISVDVTDQAVGGAPGNVDEVRLVYSVDGGDEMSVTMTNTGGDTYAGDIPAVGVNSAINYRVEADDDQNHTTTSPSVAGYNFTYRQPTEANILFVNDSGDHDGEEMYMEVLADNNFVYDYWYIGPGDADDMGYPGSDVASTDYYSTILWFNGSGYSGSLPNNEADLSTDPMAMYMDDGGNFFLTSSDYLGGAFVPAVWTEFTAEPGTFMYEYLKVDEGWSDAHLDPGTGESLDTLHYGISGDPISDEFAAAGIYSHPDPNYNDYCLPQGGGETCFETEIDGESAGIRYEGAFKMVFLPWVLEAADDMDQAKQVVLNVLEFFNENPGPSILVTQGSRYGIYSNNYADEGHPGDIPHPVVAEVADADGVDDVRLQMRWDGGAWETAVMHESEPGVYRHTFWDITSGWNTLEYRIMARDTGGNINFTGVYNAWTTGLEMSAENTYNFLLCSDQPYNDYFGVPSMDSVITDRLETLAIPLDYDVWDVDMYGTPDFWTVLNNFDFVWWIGLWDWYDGPTADLTPFPMSTAENPFSTYLAAGKGLLWSSEEMMGVWTDWTDVDFTEGDFLYDWGHVEAVIQDVGYTTLNLATPPDGMTNGMSSTLTLSPLGGVDPYGDWITPVTDETAVLFWGEEPGVGSWWAGVRDNLSQHNVIILGFCLYMMDQTNLDQYIQNVLMNWIQNPGTSVGVEPEDEVIPLVYDLQQNYPNPFNPVTQINFSLPEAAKVKMSIYNLMGQEVATLVDGRMNAGAHHVTFDASHLSSGVYFYKMKTDNFESVRKMVFVK